MWTRQLILGAEEQADTAAYITEYATAYDRLTSNITMAMAYM